MHRTTRKLSARVGTLMAKRVDLEKELGSHPILSYDSQYIPQTEEGFRLKQRQETLISDTSQLEIDLRIWLTQMDHLGLEERVHLGSSAMWFTCDLLIRREILGYGREDPEVQEAANNILDLCESACMGKVEYLNWPLLSAATVVCDTNRRDRIKRLLGLFKRQCCYDIDALSSIIHEIWSRIDGGADEETCSWREVMSQLGLAVIVG